MVEARWNGVVIASSDDTVVVEGNQYFPAASVDPAVLRQSGATNVCPRKGTARHYVDGADNPDAAWYYPEPKPEAVSVRARVAFWRGVEVS